LHDTSLNYVTDSVSYIYAETFLVKSLGFSVYLFELYSPYKNTKLGD